MKSYFLLLALTPALVWGQEAETGLRWLPKEKLYPTQAFDPTQSLTYISMNSASVSNDTLNYPTYIPFGFGFHKAIAAWGNNEISLDAGMHTQFGWREENNQFLQGTRRSQLNTDYIGRLNYARKMGDHWRLKATFLHRSTHLGDDYILLNMVDDPSYWGKDNSNYETVNVSAMYLAKPLNAYAQLGYVTRDDVPRDPMELQAGFFVQDWGDNTILKHLIFGADLRVLEHNDFEPNLKMGAGVRFAKSGMLIFEYYNGHLPYSRFEQEVEIEWFGVGLYLDPII